MEVQYKRHGKKSDKETQSPVIKLFKEMIQRENNDPEKANLLKEKQENRKRRQYSGSRLKTDRYEQRPHDSSSSEQHKRNIQYKVAVQKQKNQYDHFGSHSSPFQGEKKESRWFWETQRKPSEDTCSCVSCALKKIITSEYTCMACLGVLFLVSMLVAFLVVFRSVPIINRVGGEVVKHPIKKLKSDLLKKKIDAIQSGRGYEDEASLDGQGYYRRPWDDKVTRHLSGLAELVGHGDESYRELTAQEDTGLKYDSELSSILDTEKLNDGLNSEKLKSFYRKLIQTDNQIRKMKKGLNDLSGSITPYSEKFNFMSDRKKRSLKFGKGRFSMSSNKKKISKLNSNGEVDVAKFNLYFPPFSAFNVTKRKVKRLANITNTTEEPTGFVIEKKQIVVQYKAKDDKTNLNNNDNLNNLNNLRKVPKCSHTPKDSKSHETQLKHPFYKNTQRLDEMLDQFLDRNLPQMMADPFGIESLFQHKEKITRLPHSKHPGDKHESSTTGKTTTEAGKKELAANKPNKKITKKTFDIKQSSTRSPFFDVILSVSTILNPPYKKADKKVVTAARTDSHGRKLLQISEDDSENLGYEDVNESHADETDTREDMEHPERQKRERRISETPTDFQVTKNPMNLGGIHNPNWKGPMPLYPDELMSMIKHAALQNVHNANKVRLPADAKDISSLNLESDLNEMDYIESYSDKRYGKIAKLAQAYSDYGVLNVKKDFMKTEKSPVMEAKVSERIQKDYINNSKKLKKRSLFKKEANSEGISLEVRPTTNSREDESALKLLKVFGKHLKFGSPEHTHLTTLEPQYNTLMHTSPDFELLSSVHKNWKVANNLEEKKNKDHFRLDLKKGNHPYRSLLSIVEDDSHDQTNDSIKEVLLNENTSAITAKNTFQVGALSNSKKNLNETSKMDLSGIFMMVSDWFSALAEASDANKTMQNSDIISFTSPRALVNNDTVHIMYPNYDSDMIENIGYRSRVLMSIEDEQPVTAIFATTKETEDQTTLKADADDEAPKLTTVILSKSSELNNYTKEIMESDLNGGATILVNTITIAPNKSIVKRNAMDGSNLIFWNGLYDDEYGVKIDPLDNAIGGKRSAKGIDFVKRSGTWIQDKVRNIASNLRKKDNKMFKKEITTNRIARALKHMGAGVDRSYAYKRYQKRSNDKDESNEKSNNFNELTSKMKMVCKEAAKAVQQTRNIKIRQDEQEDTMTTSLMQQLVRLMADLVDFQVQQKTCLQLPPDLQQFLEWLTSARSDCTEPFVQNMDNKESESEQPDTESRMDREDNTDSRSDCLGTLHAVEDLIQQFNEMSDEDKSKMTGIREYLENQSQYLHKQLMNFDDYKVNNFYQSKSPLRFRRDLYLRSPYKTHPHKHRLRNNRLKRKFLKTFVKKHTRTTEKIYDSFSTIEMDRITLKGDFDKDLEDGTVKVGHKRNLKDVYYKAVEDAKKYTTFKNIHKKDIDGFDNAQIVSID